VKELSSLEFVKAEHIGHMTLYHNGITVCLTCQEEE